MMAAIHQPLSEEMLKNLFSSHYTRLVRTAYRLLQNSHDAEDVVQEVFCTLWLSKETLQIESYEGYLIRAVYNASLNYLKKDKAKLFTELDEDEQGYSPTQVSADQRVNTKEMNTRIDRAINSLPTACRTIFILSRFEHLSNREIAEALNLSVKTVENQMTKALRTLKNALGIFYFFLFLKNIF